MGEGNFRGYYSGTGKNKNKNKNKKHSLNILYHVIS